MPKNKPSPKKYTAERSLKTGTKIIAKKLFSRLTGKWLENKLGIILKF